ncbi:hypothetical protein Tco_0403733 [Tanacetum coccineum]
MKAEDQDHINDTERMLSVVLSMNEQSRYKQEKTKTRPKKAQIFNIGKIKPNQDNLHQEQQRWGDQRRPQHWGRLIGLEILSGASIRFSRKWLVSCGEGVVLKEKGEEFGFDSNKEEVVSRVEDVFLVDGVLEGAFGGDGDDDFSMGEGGRIVVGKQWLGLVLAVVVLVEKIGYIAFAFFIG